MRLLMIEILPVGANMPGARKKKETAAFRVMMATMENFNRSRFIQMNASMHQPLNW